ncbi:MAG: hypothetical protein IPG22_19415 [Acidobacteria bacterium]|nr:hypothetical protein [Acidobacteriota bacterium]
MKLIDLIIIYLACGSPFAVFQATNRQTGQAGVNWTRVLTSFLLWPAAAISLLISKFFSNETRRRAELQDSLEGLRLEFEQLVFSGESITLLFEFRETFYRFIGLSEAADEVQYGKANAEIFEISDHNNKLLASRCLARKNMRRLADHRSAAREEFVGLISRLAGIRPDCLEIVSLALELADHLHDQIAADEFQAMISARQTQDGEWTSGLEKEVWKSRTPSTSTIN